MRSLISSICLIFLVGCSQGASVSDKLIDDALQSHISGDHARAERFALMAIDMDKNNKAAYYALSQIYCAQGKVKEAFDNLVNAKNFINIDYQGFFMLAIFQRKLKKNQEAHLSFMKAFELSKSKIDQIFVLYFIDTELASKRLSEIEKNELNSVLLEHLENVPAKSVVKKFVEDFCV